MFLGIYIQGRKGAERVVPDALAAGSGGVCGGGGHRLHRPPHIPGEDRQERQVLDGAPHLQGLHRGAHLPPPGQMEPLVQREAAPPTSHQHLQRQRRSCRTPPTITRGLAVMP